MTLQVITGDATADMPDVRGERFEQAQAKLAGEGISNIRLRQASTNDPSEQGRVLDQSPRPAAASPRTTRSAQVGTPSGSGSSSSETPSN